MKDKSLFECMTLIFADTEHIADVMGISLPELKKAVEDEYGSNYEDVRKSLRKRSLQGVKEYMDQHEGEKNPAELIDDYIDLVIDGGEDG